METSEQPLLINQIIKHIWHRLSEEEVEALQEKRDIFFLAVRKKHGIARAQAELLLSDLKEKLKQAA